MNSNSFPGRCCRACAVLSLFSLSALAQEGGLPSGDDAHLTLISAGAVWRYLDNGSDPGTAWRSPNFDDSSWAAGPAQLGYGDGDEATVISYGPQTSQKHVTTYFRRAFELADAGRVTRLDLRLLRDDGAVVYLNGQEVARDNMPAGPIAFRTLAARDAGPDENQFREYNLGPTFLVNGRNVIAVEVHQANVASSDLSFDLELTATPNAWEPLPVVAIEATVPETVEPSPNTRVPPGELTITRAGNTNEPLLLFIEFTGTATLGQDFEAASQYLGMQAGETSLKVLVGPLDDSVAEGDETVVATLSPNPPINSLPNYRIDPERNQATVVIHDNDVVAVPVVSLGATRAETREPFCDPLICDAALPAPGVFRLSRQGGDLAHELSVLIQYAGSAINGTDYDALPEFATIPAGQEAIELLVNATFDQLAEGDEMVLAELLPDPSLGPIERYRVDPNQAAARIIIHDNEQPPLRPVISLELVQREAMETLVTQNAIFWGEFRVLRTGDPADELVVFLNTQQGTAGFGEDYWIEGVRDGSTVRFPPGASSVTVRLFPIDDDIYEGDETVHFHLIAPPPGTPSAGEYDIDPAHSSVAMVIHDNDPVSTRLEITSPRNGQHFEAGDVVELRAQIVGPDNGESWTVEFSDGETPIGTTQPGAPIWWQDAVGGTHVIRAVAFNPAGVALIADPVTISVGPGPDFPVVRLGVLGNGRTAEPCPVCLVAPAYFVVSRTGPTHEALNVYLEYDGPAIAGQDYETLPHRVTIPAGTNSASVLVLALDDQLAEGPEIVRARLVVPELVVGGYIASEFANQAMVVIFDDEADAPEIRLDIADPKDGAQFAAVPIIEISALGVWTQGELDRPVQFFAGDRFIGQSNPPLFARPTIPGLPSIHIILWTNPPPGEHVLTARFEHAAGLAVTSPPVKITVGEPPPTVVRIEATERIAEESSYPLRRIAFRGEFTISRTGPTEHSLPVFVHYSGTATPGADCPFLPFRVTIPAGATATRIEVVPVDDGIPEGIETLVATLSHCPPDTDPPLGMPCVEGFAIDPAHERATVFIRDDGITEASLAITQPRDGAAFDVGETIVIEAIAIDLNGYISQVGFWDATVERQIGFSEIVFIRAPDPGTPIHHSFAWSDAAPGPHILQARTVGADGTFDVLRSQPVRITVGPPDNLPPRTAITHPVSGTDFPPQTPVEIVAETQDPDGYVRRMEFFADDRKIGELSMEFFRPPDPGQTQTFTFVWHEPTPGRHTLMARATDNHGAVGTAAPVEITVAMAEPLPIVTVVAPDPCAVEPQANADLNTATFRIRRFGPTNEALVVAYSLHGTAENGTDYVVLPRLTTIPAGQRSTAVVVRPIADDLPEGIETVLLRLEEPPPSSPEIRVINPYRVGRPNLAVAVISDGPWPPASRDARCLLLPGILMHVCFAAESGQNYRIEASTDLRNWATLGNAVGSDGTLHFIDADMESHPCRFYRLMPEAAAGQDE